MKKEQTHIPTPALNNAEAPRSERQEHPQKGCFVQWIKIFLQPLLFLGVGILLIVALGVAQKQDWISAGESSSNDGENSQQASAEDQNTLYICPMMCTPPLTEPGRCPSCGMELVPTSARSANADESSIEIDPVARRVANIRTIAAKSVPLARSIRAIGKLSYDEGTMKTIAAYVDGRLERLYADYTGVVVAEGDQLALLYSPQLYSSQVELLVAKRAREQSQSTMLRSTIDSGRDLYDSARERLREFGMTAAQIDNIEKIGEANSRMHLYAPISGTVIEKLAVEGQYVKTGQPIYRLADLSKVWLMLELFPEDASSIRYGQKVEAEVQSLPGQKFTGRVAFIDPTVDPKTRTVGVRVVMQNEDGLLRTGDYAKATIVVNISGTGQRLAEVYDPELAGKWISPRHPHVVESAPGNCSVCDIPLVPASQFGFTSKPTEGVHALVIPRNAVLMAGENSVVYVETTPGRFEIRKVVIGPSVADDIAILEGLEEGEEVAYSGNFLIDSQMQLSGNPSIIDPIKAKAGPKSEESKSLHESPELIAAISELSEADQALVKKQRICPVTKLQLGSMGPPIKVDVAGRPVFICCEGCRDKLLSDPEKHLENLTSDSTVENEPADAGLVQSGLPPIGAIEMFDSESELPQMQLPVMPQPDTDTSSEIASAIAKLSPADRVLAEKQKICPVTEMPLGSMGVPIKVNVDGKSVFICCEGCREKLLAEPDKYLEILTKEGMQ